MTKIFKKDSQLSHDQNIWVSGAEFPACLVTHAFGCWWTMLDLPSEHPLSWDLTEEQAKALIEATRCFVLCNKPGMLIFGTDKTFEDEAEGGYAPVDVGANFDLETDSIWIDMGKKYARIELKVEDNA